MFGLDGFGLDWDIASDLAQIIWLDVVLSGDNAMVIGMAAATLPVRLQRRAIVFGMILATVIRIACALAATYLYEISWVRFVGGLALFFVAWKLFEEARRMTGAGEASEDAAAETRRPAARSDRRAIYRALVTITIADVSMSVDNVLAVAGVALDNRALLIFGLALSILLTAFFATMISRLLTRHPWISFVGVAVLVYVGGEMIWSSWADMMRVLGLA